MNVPTGYTALDLVGFTDKGTYASNVYYVKNDIVHYGGNLWRCKVDDAVNVTPEEGTSWTVFVGEPTNLVERIIAPLEENPATVAYATGRQIIYDDWLWEVIDDIAVGDVLVDYAVDPTNANIKKADPVETQLLAIKAKEGNLTNLTTTAKADLVSAINEVDGEIGNLSSLTTTAKTSAVAAINELDDKVSKTEDLISNSGDAYSSSSAYSVGDYVIHGDSLYRCTTACPAGSWATNQSCFTQDTLVNAIDDTALKLISDDISNSFSTSSSYIKLYANENKVILSVDITLVNAANVGVSTLIGRIPSSFKPTNSKRVLVSIATGGAYFVAPLRIDSSTGDITVDNTSSGASKLYMSCDIEYIR